MAATTQSVEYAAQVAAESDFNDRLDDSKRVSGAVQTARVKVVTTADNAANDVISLLKLPEGAMIVPELCQIVVTDDMTSGACTIDIGDDTDPDRYCDGANCAAVGAVNFLTPAIPDAFGSPYEVEAEDSSGNDTRVIKAKFASLAATIEAGEFWVILAYKTL